MKFLGDSSSRFQLLVPVLVMLILGSIGLCLYWAADRELPILAQSGVFVGWDEHNSRIGWVEWTGIRQRYCDGTSYRWLVDGVVIELPTIHIRPNQEEDVPDKKLSTWRVAFEVPEWFHQNASYRVRVEYSCNSWQKLFPLVVSLPDVPFEMPGGQHDSLLENFQSSIP